MPIDKGPFRICGKTGRIVGLRNYANSKWWLPIIGILVVIWYLIRVLPKPSRAAYPCQRVATPIALGGLVYLASVFSLLASYRNFKSFASRRRYWLAGLCLIVGIACLSIVIHTNENSVQAEDTGTFTPHDAPNQPFGVARGIKPGRVAWDYNLSACNWDGKSDYWFSRTNNDQADITLCDPARENNCSVVYDYCHQTFPNVVYNKNLEGWTPNVFAYSAPGPKENGHWRCSFFTSQDPVALESVGVDFLRAEMPLLKTRIATA